MRIDTLSLLLTLANIGSHAQVNSGLVTFGPDAVTVTVQHSDTSYFWHCGKSYHLRSMPLHSGTESRTAEKANRTLGHEPETFARGRCVHAYVTT